MLVLRCRECDSIDLEYIRLDCWNTVDGSSSKKAIYCNSCCKILSDENQYLNIDKNKLLSHINI